MRYYLSFIISSLIAFYFALFLAFFSSGVNGYIPVTLYLGQVMTFAIGAPVLVYHYHVGMLIGCVGSFFTASLIWTIAWGLPVNVDTLPVYCCALLLLLNFYGGIQLLFLQKEYRINIKNQILKLLLAIIPVLLTIYYFAFHTKGWFKPFRM